VNASHPIDGDACEAQKTCTLCGGTFPLSGFHRNNAKGDGRVSRCKQCSCEASKRHKRLHPEETKAAFRKWRENNRAYARRQRRQWAIENAEHVREYDQEYRRDHRDTIEANRRKRRASDPAKYREQRDRWYASHPSEYAKANKKWGLFGRAWKKSHAEFMLAWQRNYVKSRRRADPAYKMMYVARGRLRRALNGQVKRDRSMDILGCTPDELRAHLESQFKPGMTWENHGSNGWHVDHVIPCAFFDFSDRVEVRMCFHYSNLQPLWAHENRRKSDHVPHTGALLGGTGGA